MVRRLTLVLLVVAVGACATERPSPGEWAAEWARVRAAIPAAPAAEDGIPQAQCDTTVAALRDEASGLAPTPDDILDPAVDAWVSFARTLFFECPITTGEHAGWQAGYLELEQREREIADILSQLSQT